MEQHFRISNLITLHLSGKIDAEAKAELEAWINASPRNASLFKAIADEANLAKALREIAGTDTEIALQAVKNRVMANENAMPLNKRLKLWPRMAMTAAALAAIVFGIWFFPASPRPDKAQHPQIAGSHDIKPGKNIATLTLANGKTLTLSDAKTGVIIDASKISYNDGTQIKEPSSLAGREMTLKTPRGGTYQVILSDGTKVWLNAASALTYSTALNERGERRVSLDGEAYFEVAKDKLHPFVVESGGQLVTVLGTHFNINAYKDEPGIKTTLIEGSVSVAGGSVQTVIKPGEQASFKAGGINVEQVNVNAATDWKEGKFRFKNESLSSILRKVARWYDVDIVYQADPKNLPTFTGAVSRFDNVSAVLQMLQETSDVRFSIEGKTIKVQ